MSGAPAWLPPPESLPADLHAERSILGAILLDNAVLRQIELTPEDFHDLRHGKIFRAMVTLAGDGAPIDFVSMGDALGVDLEAVGGHVYLTTLTDGLPRSVNALHYSKIIREKADLRRLLRRGYDAALSAAQPGAKPAGIRKMFLAAAEGNHSEHAATCWAAAAPVPAEEPDGDAPEEILPGLLYRESVTRISGGRGSGKTEHAVAQMVQLALAGRRVLILDRDNAPRASRSRLRNWGGAEIDNLRHLSRTKIPPLTDAAAWATFPLRDYDVILIDSLESFMEGCGEQDSTRPSLALAALLDVVRSEGGPAVLLLSNTTKDGKRGRGSGVTEDRLDFIYEVRDCTGFTPSGNPHWWEELPDAGADAWAQRATRRKDQTGFRLAFICTKFRGAAEPAPAVYEIDFSGPERTCRNVTADLDADGEAKRERCRQDAARAHVDAVALLKAEIVRREAASEPAILTREAQELLRAKGRTRKQAIAAIESAAFVLVDVPGKGHPRTVQLAPTPCINGNDGQNSHFPKAASTAGESDADFARPHLERTGKIDHAKPRANGGDSESPILPEIQDNTPPPATADADARALALRHAIRFARATPPPEPVEFDWGGLEVQL